MGERGGYTVPRVHRPMCGARADDSSRQTRIEVGGTCVTLVWRVGVQPRQFSDVWFLCNRREYAERDGERCVSGRAVAGSCVLEKAQRHVRASRLSPVHAVAECQRERPRVSRAQSE